MNKIDLSKMSQEERIALFQDVTYVRTPPPAKTADIDPLSYDWDTGPYCYTGPGIREFLSQPTNDLKKV